MKPQLEIRFICGTLAMLALCSLSACFNAISREGKMNLRNDLPDMGMLGLSYLSTDMELDGGSIFQSYSAPDGSIYKLWLLPQRAKAGRDTVIWIVPDGKRYAVQGSSNVNIMEDFLEKMRTKYHTNIDVREDIAHALLAVAGAPAPVLWNFASLKSEPTLQPK